MMRLGWSIERRPGATLMIETKGGRIEGSRWTVRGGLKYTVKLKATLLWGDCSPM